MKGRGRKGVCGIRLSSYRARRFGVILLLPPDGRPSLFKVIVRQDEIRIPRYLQAEDDDCDFCAGFEALQDAIHVVGNCLGGELKIDGHAALRISSGTSKNPSWPLYGVNGRGTAFAITKPNFPVNQSESESLTQFTKSAFPTMPPRSNCSNAGIGMEMPLFLATAATR